MIGILTVVVMIIWVYGGEHDKVIVFYDFVWCGNDNPDHLLDRYINNE